MIWNNADIAVAPSVLSADFTKLGSDIVDIASADAVHFDVMDGHFVPNHSFGPDILKAVRSVTELPLDVHLMITNPDERALDYVRAGADNVTFHIEATNHAHRVVSAIHDAGAEAGIALNPATPISAIEEILPYVDLVLVMTVNPGFGGQAFIERSLDKLRRLRTLMAELGCSPRIEVDGGIARATAKAVCAAGADTLAAGSSVFNENDRAAAIAELRELGRAGMAERV